MEFWPELMTVISSSGTSVNSLTVRTNDNDTHYNQISNYNNCRLITNVYCLQCAESSLMVQRGSVQICQGQTKV